MSGVRGDLSALSTKTIPAKPLFEKIRGAAWATGDPGLVFLDTINRANPTPAAGLFESTNPCGEVPLLPYESCNLGSLNLPAYLSGAEIDWPALASAIAGAVRFLDDVITVNRYPVEAIANLTQANRKIGLGIMGFAEACILLGIPYYTSPTPPKRPPPTWPANAASSPTGTAASGSRKDSRFATPPSPPSPPPAPSASSPAQAPASNRYSPSPTAAPTYSPMRPSPS